MARRNRVLVQFTKDTKDAAGEVVRSEGDKLYCDPMSADSFVNKGVARKLTEKQAEKAEAELAEEPEQPSVPPFGGPAGGVG